MEILDKRISEIKQQAAIQKRNSIIIRILIVCLMIVSVIVCVLGFPVLTLYIGPGLFSDEPSYFIWIILLFVYGCFFVIPFLICLPIIVPLSIRKKNTNRIVVFRKFNDDVSKKALRKLIRSILGNYGHVFTLSDRNFKIKWYVRIPFFLGQMSFFHFRQRNIKNEPELKKLSNALRNKGWLNINWYLSSSKVFAIRTSDELWKDTARILLEECELVIFDVSTFTASLEWETNVTKELGLEHKIIVVANEKNNQPALAWKTTYDTVDDDYDIPLHFYDEEGEVIPEEFEASVLKVLARSNSATPRYTKSILQRTLVTSAVITGTFVAVLFFLSPFLIPEQAGMFSPFPGQVVQAYIQSELKDADENQQVKIRDRLKQRWPQKAASLSLSYAYDHEAAECKGIRKALQELASPTHLDDYIKLIQDGEPAMSTEAFTIVNKFSFYVAQRGYNFQDLGLKFLLSNRLDVKEKGIELLLQQQATPKSMLRLIDTLSDPRYKMQDAPAQHASKGAWDFKGILGVSDETAIQRTNRYYLKIFEFLNAERSMIDTSQLITAIDRSRDPAVSSILSLVLLKMGNAARLRNLLNSHFINNFYTAEIREPNTWYIFKDVPRPFAAALDSILKKETFLVNLPSSSEVVGYKKMLQGSVPFSASIVFFLVRNYSINMLSEFDAYIDAKTLSGCLYEHMRNSRKGDDQEGVRITIARKHDLTGYLKDTTANMEDRLNAAWLLANTGDVSVTEFLIDASNVTKQTWLGEAYPYRSQSIEILKLLIKRADKANKKEIAIARSDLSPAIKTLLRRLQQKLARL